MKVTTSLRAGKQNRGATSGGSTGGKHSSADDAPETYTPPVSRCTGI